jgi:hypothetical protein
MYILVSAHRRRKHSVVVEVDGVDDDDDGQYFEHEPLHKENETNLSIRYLCG